MASISDHPLVTHQSIITQYHNILPKWPSMTTLKKLKFLNQIYTPHRTNIALGPALIQLHDLYQQYVNTTTDNVEMNPFQFLQHSVLTTSSTINTTMKTLLEFTELHLFWFDAMCTLFCFTESPHQQNHKNPSLRYSTDLLDLIDPDIKHRLYDHIVRYITYDPFSPPPSQPASKNAIINVPTTLPSFFSFIAPLLTSRVVDLVSSPSFCSVLEYITQNPSTRLALTSPTGTLNPFSFIHHLLQRGWVDSDFFTAVLGNIITTAPRLVSGLRAIPHSALNIPVIGQLCIDLYLYPCFSPSHTSLNELSHINSSFEHLFYSWAQSNDSTVKTAWNGVILNRKNILRSVLDVYLLEQFSTVTERKLAYLALKKSTGGLEDSFHINGDYPKDEKPYDYDQGYPSNNNNVHDELNQFYDQNDVDSREDMDDMDMDELLNSAFDSDNDDSRDCYGNNNNKKNNHNNTVETSLNARSPSPISQFIDDFSLSFPHNASNMSHNSTNNHKKAPNHFKMSNLPNIPSRFHTFLHRNNDFYIGEIAAFREVDSLTVIEQQPQNEKIRQRLKNSSPQQNTHQHFPYAYQNSLFLLLLSTYASRNIISQVEGYINDFDQFQVNLDIDENGNVFLSILPPSRRFQMLEMDYDDYVYENQQIMALNEKSNDKFTSSLCDKIDENLDDFGYNENNSLYYGNDDIISHRSFQLSHFSGYADSKRSAVFSFTQSNSNRSVFSALKSPLSVKMGLSGGPGSSTLSSSPSMFSMLNGKNNQQNSLFQQNFTNITTPSHQQVNNMISSGSPRNQPNPAHSLSTTHTREFILVTKHLSLIRQTNDTYTHTHLHPQQSHIISVLDEVQHKIGNIRINPSNIVNEGEGISTSFLTLKNYPFITILTRLLPFYNILVPIPAKLTTLLYQPIINTLNNQYLYVLFEWQKLFYFFFNAQLGTKPLFFNSVGTNITPIRIAGDGGHALIEQELQLLSFLLFFVAKVYHSRLQQIYQDCNSINYAELFAESCIDSFSAEGNEDLMEKKNYFLGDDIKPGDNIFSLSSTTPQTLSTLLHDKNYYGGYIFTIRSLYALLKIVNTRFRQFLIILSNTKNKSLNVYDELNAKYQVYFYALASQSYYYYQQHFAFSLLSLPHLGNNETHRNVLKSVQSTYHPDTPEESIALWYPYNNQTPTQNHFTHSQSVLPLHPLSNVVYYHCKINDIVAEYYHDLAIYNKRMTNKKYNSNNRTDSVNSSLPPPEISFKATNTPVIPLPGSSASLSSPFASPHNPPIPHDQRNNDDNYDIDDTPPQPPFTEQQLRRIYTANTIITSLFPHFHSAQQHPPPIAQNNMNNKRYYDHHTSPRLKYPQKLEKKEPKQLDIAALVNNSSFDNDDFIDNEFNSEHTASNSFYNTTNTSAVTPNVSRAWIEWDLLVDSYIISTLLGVQSMIIPQDAEKLHLLGNFCSNNDNTNLKNGTIKHRSSHGDSFVQVDIDYEIGVDIDTCDEEDEDGEDIEDESISEHNISLLYLSIFDNILMNDTSIPLNSLCVGYDGSIEVSSLIIEEFDDDNHEESQLEQPTTTNHQSQLPSPRNTNDLVATLALKVVVDDDDDGSDNDAPPRIKTPHQITQTSCNTHGRNKNIVPVLAQAASYNLAAPSSSDNNGNYSSHQYSHDPQQTSPTLHHTLSTISNRTTQSQYDAGNDNIFRAIEKASSDCLLFEYIYPKHTRNLLDLCNVVNEEYFTISNPSLQNRLMCGLSGVSYNDQPILTQTSSSSSLHYTPSSRRMATSPTAVDSNQNHAAIISTTSVPTPGMMMSQPNKNFTPQLQKQPEKTVDMDKQQQKRGGIFSLNSRLFKRK